MRGGHGSIDALNTYMKISFGVYVFTDQETDRLDRPLIDSSLETFIRCLCIYRSGN
jgi:hypothetical protein